MGGGWGEWGGGRGGGGRGCSICIWLLQDTCMFIKRRVSEVGRG